MTIATPAPLNTRDYVNKEKAFWNEVAIAYTCLGYLCGIGLLCVTSGWLNIVGVILLSHSLTYSAYLSHEFMHGTIFTDRRSNVIFGRLMIWLNGGCYYGFQALTLQHIAHHVDRVDVFTFDIPTAIQKLPTTIRRIIFALEWCYLPIVAFWARWQKIIKIWREPERVKQITLIFLVRFTIFICLGIISLKALLLYFLAYVGMITVLRFIDAFQHTYEAFPLGSKLPKRDRDHEQFHTYSNLISCYHPWLNLLILNFGYHNAHHAVMKCPWHSIAELNLEIAKTRNIQYISLYQQLINYHNYRVTRLINGQGNVTKDLNYKKFYGAVDVSFITLY